jgi:hypothetical protein
MKWNGATNSEPRCTFRFSQPRDAFIRLKLAGLVPCRIRSWGSVLQSFAPLVQPYIVSDASCLHGVELSPADFNRRLRTVALA